MRGFLNETTRVLFAGSMGEYSGRRIRRIGGIWSGGTVAAGEVGSIEARRAAAFRTYQEWL